MWEPKEFMATIDGIKVPFIPISPPETQPFKQGERPTDIFSTVFERELDKLKFSNHANKRLESRNIQLTEIELGRLEGAVETAESKGSKDSLVMMDDKAFIINIPNRTVVTALHMQEEGEKVFTNIDSVVILK